MPLAVSLCLHSVSMIWVKHFEFGNWSVSLVPRRYDFSVVCIGYKSPRYSGWVVSDFHNFKYHVFDGSLSECNDIFNNEVSYLCAMYDSEIYKIADVRQKDDVF